MSSTDRESELNHAILLYICQSQVNGDFRALEKLGISNEVLEMLKVTTVNEVLHLCKIPSLFANIKIDNDLLGNLFEHVRREANNQELITKLIQSGAPLKLLRELTGINALEFSARRKLLKIEQLGRSQDATPEQETLIFENWEKFSMRTDLAIEEWLEFSRITGVPIKIIIKVICEEEQHYGHAN